MSELTAELVLYNANVITLDPSMPRARIVAIDKDRIIFVGDDEDIGSFGGHARCIDCEGRTVVPGFNDAHLHVFAFASSLLSIDCSPASVKSIKDIQLRIRHAAERAPAGTWIKAYGYNEFYLQEQRHPDRHDLDAAAPELPVKLSHRSMHACVLNSRALDIAGISIYTPEPPGGIIERELQSGEPSGLLYGMDTYINDNVIPPASEDQVRQGFQLASRHFLASGITSVQDATVSNDCDRWLTLQRLKESEHFLPRVNMMFGYHAIESLEKRGMGPGYGDDGLRTGSIKFMPDEVSGRLNPSQRELNEMVFDSHRAGYQVAIHAVEEGTVAAAAEALEYALKRLRRDNHRHRIEHCSVCPPALLRRLASLRCMVVTQPAFIYYNGERYLEDVPPEQLQWLYRTHSFLENGLIPAGSSDCPVIPCNPLTGIYAAITRCAANGQLLLPEESLSAEQALQLFTLHGAYSSFEEQRKGSIKAGKLADLVVLSHDLTCIEPEQIMDSGIMMTILGGRIVFEL